MKFTKLYIWALYHIILIGIFGLLMYFVREWWIMFMVLFTFSFEEENKTDDMITHFNKWVETQNKER